ncbi:MAG: methyltransferase domain-containing protein [Acidobacteriota bacterium]|nr:methyltransferase domain-containing protein [Acidobacteriota bacterium]
MTENDADEVLAAWETSSQYWSKHQARIEQMFAPLTRALIEAAQIHSGQAVLDVGGGSGEPSLTIASVVGDSGSVTYTDPSAGMVTAARDEATRRRLTNIHFHQEPAQQLSFSDNSFDVAVGRLSMMFVPDVLAGLTEILRVTKRGGRMSFLVWNERAANPFFRIISDVLDRFVPADPEDEDAPGAFRFAREGKLATLMRAAGATSVTEHVVEFQIEAPINVEEFWEMRTEMSDTFRGKIALLDAEKVAALKAASVEAVAGYFQNGGMSFPAQARVVSGEKAH